MNVKPFMYSKYHTQLTTQQQGGSLISRWSVNGARGRRVLPAVVATMFRGIDRVPRGLGLASNGKVLGISSSAAPTKMATRCSTAAWRSLSDTSLIDTTFPYNTPGVLTRDYPPIFSAHWTPPLTVRFLWFRLTRSDSARRLQSPDDA